MPVRSFMLVLVTSGLLASSIALNAQKLPASIARRIDSLFAEYNNPASAGCSMAVYHNGHIVYERGYGSASVELGVPLTGATTFDIGSTTKQFTAACILLLEQAGKLSLDDDVRKYIPELPDYGHTITIRHLLNHTSGIRDYVQLLAASGVDPHDVSTTRDVLVALVRQRALNFDPGTQHLYSNSGYFLAAVIVERVAGMPIATFADEKIFKPLGMTHTGFIDDYSAVVPNVAEGYEAGQEGELHRDVSNWESPGARGVFTSVEDLALWDENFYHPRVGGPELVTALQRRGVLNNGDTIDYALGLEHDAIRGVPIISHAGATRGFSSDLIRVPSEHTSVAVLSNLGSTNCTRLARQVLAIVLADHLPKPPAAAAPAVTPHTQVAIDTTIFDAYEGTFAMEEAPDFQLRITRDGTHYYSRATGQRSIEIFPSSDSTFFLKVVEAVITFHRGANGKVEHLTLNQGGNHVADRVTQFALDAAALKEYEGTYYSPELESTFDLTVADGRLTAAHRRLDSAVLRPVRENTFASDAWYLRDVTFERGSDGKVTAMLLSLGRMNNVRFERRR